MKKLIFKTSFFTIPFFVLYILTTTFYVNDQGDLLRLGYFSTNYGYNSGVVFKKDNDRNFRYNFISDIDLKKHQEFDILTIGDSFSELNSCGYQDYLAEYSNKKVLHFNRFLHENPLETANNLLNGDFFDKIKTKYVIIESVERYFVNRGNDLNKKATFSLKDIIEKVKTEKDKKKNVEESKLDTKKPQFFSRDLIRFPLYNLYYNFSDNAFYSPIYKVKLSKNLFSVKNNNLLFFKEDLDLIENYSSIEQIKKANDEINLLQARLNEKGIKLILLICPDKFEMYHEYFVEKSKYPTPIFFNVFDNLKKNYIYIKSKQVLGNAIKNDKDIYYFDDTHWSPKAAKIIGAEINKNIN